jgi:hypothetical protein
MALPPQFGTLFDDTSPEERAAQEEARFEDDVVHYVLTKHNQHELRRQLLAESREAYGRPQLTLAAMRDYLPFPLHLQAEKIPGVAEDLTLYRLYENFTKRKFWKRWQHLLEDRPDGAEATGLVFHFPYLKSTRLREGRGGALVLHDYQGYDVDAPGVRMTYRPPEGVSLHLETLSRLLAVVVLNGWQPEA